MRQRLAETRIFWREFRQTFTSTGAVLPSGSALARALARHVTSTRQLYESREEGGEPQQEEGEPHYQGKNGSPKPNGSPEPNRRILEIGPGTGPVTAKIIQQMGPYDTLDLVELNERFVSVLKDRLHRDSQWQSVAERIQIHCLPIEELSAGEPYEVIISGLPLNNFSCEVVVAILDRLHQLAAPDAMLSFFEYVAIRKAKSLFCKSPERRRLSGIEQILAQQLSAWEVDRECVFANVPPAWVHHLRLPGRGQLPCPLS